MRQVLLVIKRTHLPNYQNDFEVHANLISQLKQEFLERSSEIFEKESTVKTDEAEKEKLYSKIGQLEMERDFLKKIGL